MSHDRLAAARRLLERQLNYLRNPLPPGPGVCASCRGPAIPADVHCPRCQDHRKVDPAMLADAVVPISYAVRSHPDLSQHSWTLFNYKSLSTRSREDGPRLTDLLSAFLSIHASCITGVLGGRPDWYTTVPSSQGRIDHPLRTVANIPSLNYLEATIRPGYSARRRPRLFELDAIQPFQTRLHGAKVLIVDDTWVTGNTAQSLAYQLKCAGAEAVVMLTLGRWADFRDTPWRRLIERTAGAEFDVGTCAIEDCRR